MLRIPRLFALSALSAVLWLDACAAEIETDDGCVDGKCDDTGQGGRNAAGRELSEAERQRILGLLGDRQVDLDRVPTAMFVLHDTAGATSNGFMQKQAADSRGPLSDGPAVYVSSDRIFFARPFYDEWRPTSTLFERAKDIIEETEAARLGRALWSRVGPDQRTRAIVDVLGPLDLSASERSSEQQSAERQLAGEGARIFTTATWAVEQLCATGFASDPSCIALKRSSAARKERVERSVNVEIGQVAGSNCSASGVRLSPYTDAVYSNLTSVYLQSAVSAGFFPDTVTHFKIDEAFRGHCDPRCFDLDRLYRSIATTLGHDPATIYGVSPSYGTTYGKNSVWWSTSVCGAAPR